jgi:hypothetical protein
MTTQRPRLIDKLDEAQHHVDDLRRRVYGGQFDTVVLLDLVEAIDTKITEARSIAKDAVCDASAALDKIV